MDQIATQELSYVLHVVTTPTVRWDQMQREYALASLTSWVIHLVCSMVQIVKQETRSAQFVGATPTVN